MDIKEAIANLAMAWNHFENAEGPWVDAACYEIRAAEAQVDAINAAARREGLSAV